MARKEITTITLTDDLTGEEITDGGVFVKLTLEVDGERRRVELDLNKVNYDGLNETLKRYFDAGSVSTGKGAAPTGDTEYNTKVREFAAKATDDGKHTYTYNDEALTIPGPRGRVPAAWKAAYDAYVDQSTRVDAVDAAKAEAEANHASEDAINAAITAGEESVKPAKASKK